MKNRYVTLIAFIMAVWLPLLGGDALAVSVSMQPLCRAGAMHEMKQSMDAPHHAGQACHACGFCRLAGSGYLASGEVLPPVSNRQGIAPSFYRFSFISIASPPLDPPPTAAS